MPSPEVSAWLHRSLLSSFVVNDGRATLERSLAMARLARWLGPWTPASARPPGIARRRITVDGRFDAWVYRRVRDEPRGALLVVPGLHYLGPADPRLDRFLAILADAGLLVLSPFLPDLRALRVGPSAGADAVSAFDALSTLPDLPQGVRPGVFSISFGSFPALHVAAAREVGHLLLFGGCAAFEDAIRFSLEGDAERPHDPLNRPVVFLALFDHLEGLPRDRERLKAAWIEYVRRTWGRPEMKKRAAFEPLARSIAARLPEDARTLFLVGTGVLEGGPARIVSALERGRHELVHLDPRPLCRAVRAPVTIVHGRDDDVIPHTHAEMLAEHFPHARVLLTGLYAHTGLSGFDPRALVAEVSALGGILSAILEAGGLK